MPPPVIAWIGCVCHALGITSLAAKLLVAVGSLCPHRAPLFDSVVATAVDGDVVEPFIRSFLPHHMVNDFAGKSDQALYRKDFRPTCISCKSML